MLGSRITVSALLIPSFIVLCCADAMTGAPAPVLLGLCLLLVLRGAWELVALLSIRSFRPSYPLTATCCSAVLLAGWSPHVFAIFPAETSRIADLGPIALAGTLSVLALMLAGTLRYRQPGQSIETLGAELIVVTYIGILIAVTAQLRWVGGGPAGYLALGSLIVAAKCGDIAAYTLGRLFGRRKMVPRLSPGKTWMGGLGAILGAAAASVLWLHFATPAIVAGAEPSAWYWSVLYGAAIGGVGLLGDLCESLIKRDVEAKDSAELLPGFGGVLDLIDSVIFAGPVAWVLWQILPLGR